MKFSEKNKPVMVSLFTGAGGLDEGFKAAGFHVHACMDIEEWACDTLKHNNPSAIIVGPPNYSGNIKTISPQDFSEIIGLKPGEIDVLAGGPPCQPFSMAAAQRFLKTDEQFKRKGFDDQDKGTLLFDYIEYIKWFKPRVFVIENVPGLLTIDDGIQLNKSLQELREIGYRHTQPATLNAVDFGVPQFRERCIIWGTLEKDSPSPELPSPTHYKDKSPYWKTVSQALVNLRESSLNHVPREHKLESVLRYETLLYGEREQKGRVDRLHPLKPSKTIIAGGSKGGGRSHLHPLIPRTMTVRESARIQTFKDSYLFKGSIARQFTQVGNAVPPLLAENIARKIMITVFNYEIKTDFEHRLNTQLNSYDSLNKLLEECTNEKKYLSNGMKSDQISIF